MNAPSPRRFKFTLKDDQEFNFEVIVDVLKLNNKNVLHVVDTATGFNAARFLSNMSAKETFNALRSCWIDVYLGPPDIITHDAGTNFASQEFRAEAKLLGNTCKQVHTEAYWSIGKVERYHQPLRRAYNILSQELKGAVPDESILQMSVKTINDTAGPNGLVPTLLVFGAYPRVTIDSPPSAGTLRRAEAVCKAMKDLRAITAQRRVNDALNTRNGPICDSTALPIGSEVRVWRENDGWQGPYKILQVDDHNVVLDMVNGPTSFRSTVCHPYYRPPTEGNDKSPTRQSLSEEARGEPQVSIEDSVPMYPNRRGRPKGSKDQKPRQKLNTQVKAQIAQLTDPSLPRINPQNPAVTNLTVKEEVDANLAIKLRNEGVITTPGKPFEVSDMKEINDLVANGVFKFELFDPAIHHGRIFKSRMVREIKGKNEKPYEKSRLVIQGHTDNDKKGILTQSPTIQRMSQRLILALAPGLINKGMIVSLRDITQAYPQAKSTLRREIYAELPRELKENYPKGTIMRVIKPLYGIAEAGVHWFYTYQEHHKVQLQMETSTYDPCLLITTNSKNGEGFGMVGMQTDDTLMLGTKQFSLNEEEQLHKAEFRAKPKIELKLHAKLNFNGAQITMEDNEGVIHLRQKGQGARIEVISSTQSDRAQRYLEQRARGAYLASICQPEASFDLSVAAQVQKPEDEDFKKINKRLQWQIDHPCRGLRYIPIDLTTAKLMVFADGSFANNKDMSSQLGFILMLVNEKNNSESFTLIGNLLHWSSTKCKRVTRSVLASEIYGMVNGFDIGFAIASTLRKVADQLALPAIPIVVCTDSYSLYECLVKLGTTKEKRLMIDIMALRQSYERREIAEIRWINGEDNPADAMTKVNPNKALESFIDTNSLSVRIEGFVERPFNSRVSRSR